METEPLEINPFMGMTDDELYEIIKDVQLEQREINRKNGLLEQALMKNYADRLGR